MPGGNYYTMYRKILRIAWKRTWGRKHLWLFGFFAALLSTGGVADVTLQSFQQIKTSGRFLQQAVTGVFLNLDAWSGYVRQMSLMEPTRLTITATIVSLLVIGVVVLAVLSQGALTYALTKRKAFSLKRSVRESAGHFWSILGLNLIAKAAQIVLVISIALPTVLVFTRGTLFDAFISFTVFLILFPATVALHIIAMIALIDIVRRDHSLSNAIHHAAVLFKKHWLVTLELGIIIFLLVFGAGIVFVSALFILSIPYTALSLLSFYTTPILTSFLQLIAITTVLVLVVVFAGGATTFQYACWVRWFERSTHGRTKDKVMAKLERWWRQAWS